MQQALGLIETIGLAAAYEAADTALKTANVELIGYELSKGDGMVTVKIMGRVGAVQAGVTAAKSAASIVSKVFSTKVIPRPSRELDAIVFTEETVLYQPQTVEVLKEEIDELSNIIEEVIEEPKVNNNTKVVQKTSEVEEEKQISLDEVIEESNTITCNMCEDPECTRKKGQPKRYCKHYFTNMKEKKNG